MVTTGIYKTYINQIAALFCGADSLCKSYLSTRLISKLSNTGFENFLANINKGRGYIHHFSNLERIDGTNWKVDTTFYDLITNERIAGNWVFAGGETPRSKLPGVLASNGFQIIDGLLTYDPSNVTQERIMWKPSKLPGYGITFVPQTVGTPGGGGGGSTPGGGGGGSIIPTPVQPQPLQPVEGGIDLKSLLENPIVLIGGAVLLFLLFKDKL